MIRITVEIDVDEKTVEAGALLELDAELVVRVPTSGAMTLGFARVQGVRCEDLHVRAAELRHSAPEPPGNFIRSARAVGRCADGAERDGGRLVHWVFDASRPTKAACGYRPGRTSGGWERVNLEITCPRCRQAGAKQPTSG